MPAAAEKRLRTADSVSNCRTILARLAPNARRTAISRCRADALANRRFATFTQAINRMNATASKSEISSVRVLPTTTSFNGLTDSVQPAPAG